jgi:hypothetical protein
VGAERAAAEPGLAGGRDCAALGAGLRAGVPASPAPVVSADRAAGSAVMMLTGGIEDAEGKYRLLDAFGATAGAVAAGGWLLATGRSPAAGQPAA